jgi:hypothetical protein
MRPLTPLSRFALHATAAIALSVVSPSTAHAQSRVVKVPAAVLATPKGRAIGSVHPGVSVRVIETRGAYAKVAIDGFIERTRLSGDRRNSSPRVGARSAVVRSSGATSARSVASLDAGTVVSVGTGKSAAGWVRVSRDGWVLRSALDAPAAAKVARAPAAARRPSTPPGAAAARKSSAGEVAATPSAVKPPPVRPAPAVTPKSSALAAAPLTDSLLVPTSNTVMRAAPDARPLATIAKGAPLIPLSRERGWVRVRIEGWVQEGDVAPADTSVRTGVSAADLRADPQGSRGKVVRWSVQVLATQKADVLRRDLAPDEVYLLARGPSDENSLLYLVVPASLMSSAKAIPELTQAMITARVRIGKSELVGVPILDLLSITPRK